MELLRNNDITKKELEKLIEKRPEVWGKFKIYLNRLP